MSFNQIKTKLQSERGFTIVELLIVVVVIGILAAITLVAYNGVTARANTTSAKAAASSLIKKIEAYNAEKSGYPATIGALTASADSGTSYYVPTGTFVFVASNPTTAPANPATLVLSKCGTGTNQAVVTGYSTVYWDYQTSAVSTALTTGVVTGTVNAATVSCAIITA